MEKEKKPAIYTNPERKTMAKYRQQLEDGVQHGNSVMQRQNGIHPETASTSVIDR